MTIIKSTTCRCVRNHRASSNWMRHGLLSTTWKPSVRTVSEYLAKAEETRQFKSKVKIILIKFFDVRGFIHYEIFLQYQTMNKHVFKEILCCMVCLVHEKRQELWKDKSWLLHHNNAPAHNALSICLILSERKIVWFCSVGLLLFSKLKGIIEKTPFVGEEAINVTFATSQKIPFQDCVEALKEW